MPDVYNQDEGRAEIDIRKKVIPTRGFEVRRPPARRWRPHKNLGAVLLSVRDIRSTVEFSGFCRHIRDQVTPKNPRKVLCQALIKASLQQAWLKLLHQHEKQDQKQEQTKMTSAEITELLERQLAEYKNHMGKEIQYLAEKMDTGFNHQTEMMDSVASRLSTEIDSKTSNLDIKLIGLKESVDRVNKDIGEVKTDVRDQKTESRNHYRGSMGISIAILGLIIAIVGGSWCFGNKNIANINTLSESKTNPAGIVEFKDEFSQLKGELKTVSNDIKGLSQSQQIIQEQLQKIQPAKQQ